MRQTSVNILLEGALLALWAPQILAILANQISVAVAWLLPIRP